VHAIAVIFDFVEPLIAFGCGVDQLRELRQDPVRQGDRVAAAAGYRPRYAGKEQGLWCRRIRREISAYPSAMARRAPTVRAAS
jgi:hypothetical protein